MNYTNIDQSKKLVELGIDTNTADLYYNSTLRLDTNEVFWDIRVGNKPMTKCQIPCWSTGALLNLLPKTIIDKDVDHEYNLFIDMASEMPCYIWCSDCYLSDFPNDFLGEDLISNLIKCIKWLKENKYL